jgi:hypothetical protein
MAEANSEKGPQSTLDRLSLANSFQRSMDAKWASFETAPGQVKYFSENIGQNAAAALYEELSVSPVCDFLLPPGLMFQETPSYYAYGSNTVGEGKMGLLHGLAVTPRPDRAFVEMHLGPNGSVIYAGFKLEYLSWSSRISGVVQVGSQSLGLVILNGFPSVLRNVQWNGRTVPELVCVNPAEVAQIKYLAWQLPAYL